MKDVKRAHTHTHTHTHTQHNTTQHNTHTTHTHTHNVNKNLEELAELAHVPQSSGWSVAVFQLGQSIQE